MIMRYQNYQINQWEELKCRIRTELVICFRCSASESMMVAYCFLFSGFLVFEGCIFYCLIRLDESELVAMQI